MAQMKMEMAMELMWQVKYIMIATVKIIRFIFTVGTVIGDNFGLARKATAIAVRVLNNSGSGSFA